MAGCGLSGVLLSACADFTIVDTTPLPSAATLSLPPIGFNHRYGNNPLSSKDGYALERQFFAEKIFWEVAIRIDPVQAGYINLGDANAVRRARHSVTSVLIVIATEYRYTIDGLLAFPTDAGQESYGEAVLQLVCDLGYDNFNSAQLLIFFTESDEHAKLAWSAGAGYMFKVFDNDLRGTALTPLPQTTPLPAPPPPAVAPSPSPTASP